MKESEAKETLERLYTDSTNEAYPFTEQFGEAVNVAIQALENFRKQMKKENADGCAGCAFEIALWKHHLLHVPHAILSQIVTENIKIMREEYKYIAKMV
jgi:hypothetical protein